MSKISFLIAFSLLNLILRICAESSKEGQDAEISGIVYDDEELKLKQCLQDANALCVFKSLITKVFAKGITKGIAMGIAEGYQMADSKNFLSYFKCAVTNSKIDLEAYTGASESLYQIRPDPLSNEGKWIPSDIESDIKIYDAWVPYYDELSIRNGDIPNPPTYFEADSYALDEFLDKITTISKNWYLIVTCPYGTECPVYVCNLQEYLKGIQQHNPNKYKTEEEIYQRFAVYMARSFKMMSVLHNKVLPLIDEFSKGDLKPFLDLLFKCVPSFYIPEEQLFFLNALRTARDPNSEPLQHYAIKNKHVDNEQWTILPFDNSSRCPFADLRNMSTTIFSTLTPITSPVTPTNSKPFKS